MSAFINWLKSLFRDPPGMERPSPPNQIHPDEITYDQTEGIIKIDLKPMKARLGLTQNPLLAKAVIPNTNSMEPMIDEGSNILPLYGATPEDHAKLVASAQVGDVCLYENNAGGLIIHQVWKIENGLYTFGGINNQGIADKPPVKADRIKYVNRGVIN